MDKNNDPHPSQRIRLLLDLRPELMKALDNARRELGVASRGLAVALLLESLLLDHPSTPEEPDVVGSEDKHI